MSSPMKNCLLPVPVVSVIRRAKRTRVFLFLAALGLCTVRPTYANPAGTLINPREFHTATRLLDGRVLLAGGLRQPGGELLDSCEIYDPATNSWTATGSLNQARDFHQAVLLADGRVLVADGRVAGGFPTKTVEIFDPASGSWSFTKAMLNPPGGNLVLLADGRVLAAGGDEQKAANCELYDPGTGTWSVTGSLNIGRGGFEATRLNDGRVLIVGGTSPTMGGFIAQCELYDPTIGIWSLSGVLNGPRGFHEQVLLSDGRVLVAGGEVGHPRVLNVTRTAEIFDPNTGIWTLTRPMTTARVDFTANLLNDGNVFAAGGTSDLHQSGALTSIEDFDPVAGRWHLLTTTLATPRQRHAAITLLDGSVLIAGGIGAVELCLPDAEIFKTPH